MLPLRALIAALLLSGVAGASVGDRCPCSQAGLFDWTSGFTAVYKFEKFLPSTEAFPPPAVITSEELLTVYGFLDLAQHTHNLTPGTFTGGAFPTLFIANPNSSIGGEGCHALQEQEVFQPDHTTSLGGNVSALCGFSCLAPGDSRDADFHYPGSFTVGALVKSSKLPPAYIAGVRTGAGQLVGNLGAEGPDPAGTRKGYSLYYSSDGHFVFRMTRAGSMVEATSSATYAADNTWHAVAGRYVAPSTMTVLVDGVERGSSVSPPLIAWSDFFKVGFSAGSIIGAQDTTWAVGTALDTPSINRLATCGMDGCKGPCRCDPATPANYATVPSHSGSLVACNAPTFTTLATVTTTSSTTSTSSSTSSTTSTAGATTSSTSTSTSTSSTSTTCIANGNACSQNSECCSGSCVMVCVTVTTTSTSTSSSTNTTTSTTGAATTTTLATLACSVLDHGSTNTDSTSIASASVTPGSNHLILGIVWNAKNTLPDIPTASGNSLTYVSVGTLAATTGNLRRVTVFRALGASPTAGAVTFDCGANTQLSWAWTILDCTPVDATGTNGSGAIVQTATATGTSNAPSVTLSAFGSANNLNVSVVVTATSTLAAGSGFTQKSADTTSSPVMVTLSETKLNDPVGTATAGASVTWGIRGIEVKHQ